jgi:beta-glucosidase
MAAFPPGFLFGTATAATQVEGHCDATDWSRFAKEPGRIRFGDSPAIACDQYHRFREDVSLQRALGLGAHRFGVEWARIEPADGRIDEGAIEHYRALLGALREASIVPMITLHHFALPIWLADRGGILAPEFEARFVAHVRRITSALGDLCDLWITINEPNVYVAFGYVTGHWPPCLRSPAAAFRAHRRLLSAHHAAYRAIHEIQPHARVGVAHHLRVITPRTTRLRDRLATAAYRAAFNDAFAAEVCARGTHDFFGVNYYGRDLVRLSRSAEGGFLDRAPPTGAVLSDLGWEIHPEGLGVVLDQWAERAGVPIWITENGIADARDALRPAFLVAHLAEVARAIARGIDVRGYLHWSLLDNFEWTEGYGPRFGLVAVDYATQARTPRPSARLYAEIARTRIMPRPA